MREPALDSRMSPRRHTPFDPGVSRLICLFALVLVACSPAPRVELPDILPTPELTAQWSGTSERLQAVSVVSEHVLWVSGTGGTYARTTNGGVHWHAARVPGADSLEFRDVHAVDSLVAYLLSAGPGERSRIYKTSDGGRSWAVQFVNRDSSAFFDCFDFWSPTHGIAFSDASSDRFPIVVTRDGLSWSEIPARQLPRPQPDEGGFAASGTCVVTARDGRAWIGTGNAPTTRVLRTADAGARWSASSTPIAGGEARGITSIAFRDEIHGVAMGGPIAHPDSATDNVAITGDGGVTWSSGGRPTFTGAIYGGVYIPGARPPLLVAVGPRGASYSRDDGRSWTRLDTASAWSVGFASPAAGWLVGPQGRIARVRFDVTR